MAIELDLNGRKLTLDESVVRDLQVRAAAGAGASSTLRDLAFMLDRALSEERQVSLQRAEARALERLLSERPASE
jgi:CubicO group peptidase (beta-lactamase class C family)